MTIELHGHVRRGDLALDIDLSLEPGLTTVAGGNGAGKTTLLRTLAGLEALDGGSLVIDGRVLDDASRSGFVAAHDRDVALLFQDHRLFPHLDALDNVAFAARRRGVARATARRAARDALAAVEMADFGSRRPDSLSLGQRQRVAIARTLAAGAGTVLLDEPLAAVDDAGRTTLRDALRSFDATNIVWVTHDPVDAAGAPQRVSAGNGTVRKTSDS
ncbi:MAG: ATP-binding cassette domain-containing protein [Acidimicrobiales bacterium]|nr:ATP-binding cassette domain-containing protein [Acidimicrobiales bacterium]